MSVQMLTLASNTRPRIRLIKLAFIIYYHTDLRLAKQFLIDLGLSTITPAPTQAEDDESLFFSGYGTEPFIYIARHATEGQIPAFGGAAYEVKSRDELEQASALIPGASQITPLRAPGGGEIVTLHDPIGHPLHLVHGQKPKPSSNPYDQDIFINYPDSTPRKPAPQKPKPGPAPVEKLGHYCLTYPPGQYHELYEWYTVNLTLSPSEIVYYDFTPTSCTMHIDRGTHLTDHSTFSLTPTRGRQAPRASIASFKLHDHHVQSTGRKWLQSKGYEQCWDAEKTIQSGDEGVCWYDASRFTVVRPYDPELRLTHSVEVSG